MFNPQGFIGFFTNDLVDLTMCSITLSVLMHKQWDSIRGVWHCGDIYLVLFVWKSGKSYKGKDQLTSWTLIQSPTLGHLPPLLAIFNPPPVTNMSDFSTPDPMVIDQTWEYNR